MSDLLTAYTKAFPLWTFKLLRQEIGRSGGNHVAGHFNHGEFHLSVEFNYYRICFTGSRQVRERLVPFAASQTEAHLNTFKLMLIAYVREVALPLVIRRRLLRSIHE